MSKFVFTEFPFKNTACDEEIGNPVRHPLKAALVGWYRYILVTIFLPSDQKILPRIPMLLF